MTQPATDITALAFFPSDHGAVEGGKVYANGAFWDRLRFPTYPQVLPISLVAVLRIPYRAYLQDHTFEMSMVDSDETELPLRVDGDFRVGASPDMRTGDPTTMPVAVRVNNVTIPQAGDYSFVLKVDGAEIARYAFRAVQIATPTQAPPTAKDEPGDTREPH